MDKRLKAGKVAQLSAGIIVHTNNFKPKPPVTCRTKKHGEFSSGYCTLCKESFLMITTNHLDKHGFKNRKQMVDSGIVKFNGVYDG